MMDAETGKPLAIVDELNPGAHRIEDDDELNREQIGLLMGGVSNEEAS